MKFPVDIVIKRLGYRKLCTWGEGVFKMLISKLYQNLVLTAREFLERYEKEGDIYLDSILWLRTKYGCVTIFLSQKDSLYSDATIHPFSIS